MISASVRYRWLMVHTSLLSCYAPPLQQDCTLITFAACSACNSDCVSIQYLRAVYNIDLAACSTISTLVGRASVHMRSSVCANAVLGGRYAWSIHSSSLFANRSALSSQLAGGTHVLPNAHMTASTPHASLAYDVLCQSAA
jgi:hypothetical protein